MRYVGGGSFYIGVPARDLTAEEAERYREVLVGSPLYEPANEQTDEQPAGETPAADEANEGE
jgi:hypothetical protein